MLCRCAIGNVWRKKNVASCVDWTVSQWGIGWISKGFSWRLDLVLGMSTMKMEAAYNKLGDKVKEKLNSSWDLSRLSFKGESRVKDAHYSLRRQCQHRHQDTLFKWRNVHKTRNSSWSFSLRILNTDRGWLTFLCVSLSPPTLRTWSHTRAKERKLHSRDSIE